MKKIMFFVSISMLAHLPIQTDNTTQEKLIGATLFTASILTTAMLHHIPKPNQGPKLLTIEQQKTSHQALQDNKERNEAFIAQATQRVQQTYSHTVNPSTTHNLPSLQTLSTDSTYTDHESSDAVSPISSRKSFSRTSSSNLSLSDIDSTNDTKPLIVSNQQHDTDKKNLENPAQGKRSIKIRARKCNEDSHPYSPENIILSKRKFTLDENTNDVQEHTAKSLKISQIDQEYQFHVGIFDRNKLHHPQPKHNKNNNTPVLNSDISPTQHALHTSIATAKEKTEEPLIAQNMGNTPEQRSLPGLILSLAVAYVGYGALSLALTCLDHMHECISDAKTQPQENESNPSNTQPYKLHAKTASQPVTQNEHNI